jgi:uncharacterized protein with von Willebrand factor type A (vWA) domain
MTGRGRRLRLSKRGLAMLLHTLRATVVAAGVPIRLVRRSGNAPEVASQNFVRLLDVGRSQGRFALGGIYGPHAHLSL